MFNPFRFFGLIGGRSLEGDVTSPAVRDQNTGRNYAGRPTSTMVVIDQKELFARQGKIFYINQSATLIKDATMGVAFRAPAVSPSKIAILYWEIYSPVEIEFNLYFQAGFSANGTEVVAKCSNEGLGCFSQVKSLGNVLSRINVNPVPIPASLTKNVWTAAAGEKAQKISNIVSGFPLVALQSQTVYYEITMKAATGGSVQANYDWIEIPFASAGIG